METTMTCSDIQAHLLLQASGELPDAEALVAGAHVATCDACQQFDADMGSISTLSRRHLPDDGPSSGVIDAILAHAAEPPQEMKPRVVPFPMRRLFAMAASLAVLMTVIALMQHKLNEEVGVVVTSTIPGLAAPSQYVADLQNVAALMSEAEGENGDEPLDEVTLATLGDELLKMQGFELYDDNYVLN